MIDNGQGHPLKGDECFTELMGTLATARVDKARVRPGGAPRTASYRWRGDFPQRYRAAYVEEFDTFPRCVRDGTRRE